MPQIYNGGQSPLEYYAINGQFINGYNPNPGFNGRVNLLTQTRIGSPSNYAAYPFNGLNGGTTNGAYRNPIFGNPNDQYGVTHLNSLSDTITEYNGKGTNDQIDVSNTYNGVTARINYNGGNIFDRSGVPFIGGSGRDNQLTINSGLWGYGPGQTNVGAYGSNYQTPNTSLNIGQVIL